MYRLDAPQFPILWKELPFRIILYLGIQTRIFSWTWWQAFLLDFFADFFFVIFQKSPALQIKNTPEV